MTVDIYNDGAKSEFLLLAECVDINNNPKNEAIEVNNEIVSNNLTPYCFLQEQFQLEKKNSARLSYKLSFNQIGRYILKVGIKKQISYLDLDLNEQWADTYNKKLLLVEINYGDDDLTKIVRSSSP